MVTEIRTLFTLGKGPVSSFNNEAKIWVADMTAKEQATLDLPKKLVRAELLDEFQIPRYYVWTLKRKVRGELTKLPRLSVSRPHM